MKSTSQTSASSPVDCFMRELVSLHGWQWLRHVKLPVPRARRIYGTYHELRVGAGTHEYADSNQRRQQLALLFTGDLRLQLPLGFGIAQRVADGLIIYSM